MQVTFSVFSASTDNSFTYSTEKVEEAEDVLDESRRTIESHHRVYRQMKLFRLNFRRRTEPK